MTLVQWEKLPKQASRSALNQNVFTGLFGNLFDQDLILKEHPGCVPAANIREEKDNFSLELFVPGFNKEDFGLKLDEDMIVISASHREEKAADQKFFLRKEYSLVSFQRAFRLPARIRKEAIEAQYENGLLKIKLPKNTRHEEFRQIPVS
jgi:HSP20 family protein